MSRLILFAYTLASIVIVFVTATFLINNKEVGTVAIKPLVVSKNQTTTKTVPALSVEKSEKVVVNSVNSGGLNIRFGSLPGTGSFFAGVKGTKATDVHLEVIRNPSRIVLDLIGDTSGINETINFSTNILRQVRSGRHKDKTRLVFDVNDSISKDNVSLEFSNGNAILVVIK